MFGFFSRVKKAFTSKLQRLFSRSLDAETLEELEETLIEANFGVKLTTEILSTIKKGGDPMEALRTKLIDSLIEPPQIALQPKHVLLIVGVNGSGKTTTCAKLLRFYKEQGVPLIAAAADTFRAAAKEQLGLWCNKLDVALVTGSAGADPASVAVEGLQQLLQGPAQLLLIDTAGRLESKTDLMRELEKIRSVLSKRLPGAPHETILVLDASTGQNALDQARVFHQHCPLSAVILTKVDSMAKPGTIFAIQKELAIPVLFLGTGEKQADLVPFNRREFVQSLLA